MYVTTAPRRTVEPSLVFVDETGDILDRIPLAAINGRSRATGRRAPPATPAGAPGAARSGLTFRGIVYALWNARRLGYRRLAVHSDDPTAVAQLTGDRGVDPAAVGAYLEARALMHLYRSASIDVGELVLSADAGDVSVAAAPRYAST